MRLIALAFLLLPCCGSARAQGPVALASDSSISFAADVAPILHRRCVLCHNARSAKGRLNLESYAALFKGGESGTAIERGDSENSLLCILLADGSMPKEADPLPVEQQELIAQWVRAGAPLDAGVDPRARLIEIMPRIPSPAPPEIYPVPIPVTAVAFSPDGRLLATSGYHEVLLWDPDDGTLLRRIPNVAERVYDLDFSPDGSRLAVAAGTPAETGDVKVFDVASGELLADLVRVEDSMFGVAFSPDETKLAACGSDRSVRLFDAADYRQLRHVEDHADWVLGLAWSPDGAKLASAGRDKAAKVFDVVKGESIATFNGHGETVSCVAFLPGGAQVASGGADKEVRIWNVDDLKQTRRYGVFEGEVLRVIVMPDGKMLTAAADKVVRLHDTADGKLVQRYVGAGDWIYGLAVDPTSRRVAAGSYNGRVSLWNLDDGALLRQWTAVPNGNAATK